MTFSASRRNAAMSVLIDSGFRCGTDIVKALFGIRQFVEDTSKDSAIAACRIG